MAYDDKLANRVRTELFEQAIDEKKMFGGPVLHEPGPHGVAGSSVMS